MNALNLDTLTLQKGAHKSADYGMCVMEAVAYMAGEKFSDAPKCASVVIAAFMRRLNDRLPDEERQALKKFIPRLIGTRAGPAVERKRGWLAADWAVRVALPATMRAIKRADLAVELESLAELKDRGSATAARPVISRARSAASAAWSAAAWSAAAAAAAAWSAAAAAADAAAAAAAAAAADAAADAAAAAAADAAARALRRSLNESAHGLIEKMLAVA